MNHEDSVNIGMWNYVVVTLWGIWVDSRPQSSPQAVLAALVPN